MPEGLNRLMKPFTADGPTLLRALAKLVARYVGGFDVRGFRDRSIDPDLVQPAKNLVCFFHGFVELVGQEGSVPHIDAVAQFAAKE